MWKLDDLSGKRFGKLVVVKRAPNRIQKSGQFKVMWECQCDCGNVKDINSFDLKSGATKSCGCMHNEIFSKIRKTHGMYGTRIYRIWNNMRERCTNKNVFAFKDYGGRGIEVYQEWANFEIFYKWAKSAGYSDSLTLERKDVNGNYCPENCCWIPAKLQSRNTRKTFWITYQGETKCAAEWSEITGIPRSTLYNRKHKLKWSDDKIIGTSKKSVKAQEPV